MWVTPKTNWYGGISPNGEYVGDRFNAVDFNRIKNNLIHLRDMAVAMYESFTIISLGNDRTHANYLYADEINQLEENLETINVNTLNRAYGTAPTYADNGNTMDFAELNRIEGAIADLYNHLLNEYYGRRMFTWNFGMRGGEL